MFITSLDHVSFRNVKTTNIKNISNCRKHVRVFKIRSYNGIAIKTQYVTMRKESYCVTCWIKTMHLKIKASGCRRYKRLLKKFVDGWMEIFLTLNYNI